jgi:hypothetical protein
MISCAIPWLPLDHFICVAEADMGLLEKLRSSIALKQVRYKTALLLPLLKRI